MIQISEERRNSFVGRAYRLTWIVLSVTIFGLISSRILGDSQDWLNYESFFESLRDEGLSLISSNRFEPGFTILSYLFVSVFPSNLSVFAGIAAIAFFMKCWVLNQFSINRAVFFLLAIFYLIRFAPLHEFTQLRVAFSISWILVAFVLVVKKNITGSLIACAAGLAFHLSAAVAIPFVVIIYFDDRLRLFTLKKMLFISATVFLTTLLTIKFSINYLQDNLAVIAMYQEAGFGDEAPNLLSPALLLDWGMIFIALFMWNKLPLIMRYVIFVEIVGMAIFYASIDFQVIAFRIREFFAVFWVFFIAQGLEQKYFIRDIIICFLVVNMVLYSYYFFFNDFFS